jgi:L-asparagine transporter-like permease
MNFVVLSAALSSALCNLYFTARMLFSLSRSGFAPARLGRLSKRGMPVAGLAASSIGMAVAMVFSQVFHKTAFLFLINVTFFGGPFAWLITLATHIGFRNKMAREGRKITRIAPLGAWSSAAGIAALLTVLVSTWWIPDFHLTLLAGPPWLIFLTVCYFVWRKFGSQQSSPEAAPHG